MVCVISQHSEGIEICFYFGIKLMCVLYTVSFLRKRLGKLIDHAVFFLLYLGHN